MVMGFKPWQLALLRFLAIYVSINVILIVDLLLFGPFTMTGYNERATVIGIGGIAVALMMTRFGGGSAEDGTFYAADEEAEIRRKSRRGWMYAALWVAIVLLFTAGISQWYF